MSSLRCLFWVFTASGFLAVGMLLALAGLPEFPRYRALRRGALTVVGLAAFYLPLAMILSLLVLRAGIATAEARHTGNAKQDAPKPALHPDRVAVALIHGPR